MVGSPSELSTFFHNDINTLSRPVASNRAGRDNHSIRVRCCQLLARAKGSACFSFSSRLRWPSWENVGGSKGRGPGGPCSPVFLDQSKARRVEKIIWRPPPASYHRVCMTAPSPPPPLHISRSRSGTGEWPHSTEQFFSMHMGSEWSSCAAERQDPGIHCYSIWGTAL